MLKETSVYSEDRFSDLEQAYADDYDMRWIGMYGFNNTYRLAVNRSIAEQYDLRHHLLTFACGFAEALHFSALSTIYF